MVRGSYLSISEPEKILRTFQGKTDRRVSLMVARRLLCLFAARICLSYGRLVGSEAILRKVRSGSLATPKAYTRVSSPRPGHHQPGTNQMGEREKTTACAVEVGGSAAICGLRPCFGGVLLLDHWNRIERIEGTNPLANPPADHQSASMPPGAAAVLTRRGP